MSTQQPQATLYERLGGVYSIATVVEDLIDRIMVDPRLNANPRVDEVHHKVPPAGFKYLEPKWSAGPRVARNGIPGAPWSTPIVT